VDGAGDADTAGFRQALQARGDVDAIAVDLLALHHYVANLDPNAKLHPPECAECIGHLKEPLIIRLRPETGHAFPG
jgi:hypothetical protein